jgi:hypothetical protein
VARIPTAALAATGLIGGYGVAAATGRRELGGAVLAVAGGVSAWRWNRQSGPVASAALTTAYIAAFGGSHPLAKKIGAWPSVLAVTGATAAASWALADRKGRAGVKS